jgi:class 3 adenylate cyclase
MCYAYWSSSVWILVFSSSKSDYCFGDDVNFCSRLEGFDDNDQIIISKELNNALRKITNNNTFRTKKIKISKDKKLKTYEYVKHVYELIGKNKQVLD